MNNKLSKIACILLFLMILSGCGAHKAENSAEKPVNNGSYVHIGMEEAEKIISSGSGLIIVDVRRPDEFSDGHIPHAVNIPNESIGDQAPESLPDKDQLILIYCRSGVRAADAAKKLAALGYTNIKEFGGILSWNGEIEK